MAKIKKITKKKGATKDKIIEIKVINDSLVPKKDENKQVISLVAGKTETAKVYPPIYTYIYEREPEDMARIYEEHRITQEVPKKKEKISGFKVVGNKLVAVSKAAKR